MSKTPKIKKTCWKCGKEFYVTKSDSNRKFCPNSNCYNEYKETPEYREYLKSHLKK
jgi:hypothetical protein